MSDYFIALLMDAVVSVSVSVSAETESFFRFRYRFRPKRKKAVSASFGFGRNEKKPFGRTLSSPLPNFQILAHCKREACLGGHLASEKKYMKWPLSKKAPASTSTRSKTTSLQNQQ